ncbi:MAG: serine protease [Methylocella sp.]
MFDNETVQRVEADICKDPTVPLTGPEPGILLGTGTGFYISTNGQVLTNHHVVYGCASVTIDRGGSGDVPLQVLGEDSGNDLAILKEAGVVTSPLEFRPLASGLRVGESAILIGYPLRSALNSETLTEGSVSADNSGNRPRFQMTTPIQSGNSGGPVFDRSGRVIGIAVSSLKPEGKQIVQNVNFAVKIDPAQELALPLGVHLTFSESAAALSTPDIFDQVKSRVLPLNCYN